VRFLGPWVTSGPRRPGFASPLSHAGVRGVSRCCSNTASRLNLAIISARAASRAARASASACSAGVGGSGGAKGER
jgi:hypothetical protein